MTPSEQTPARNKHLTIYLIVNFLIVAFMLSAVPIIRSGQAGYLPHANIDREFVVTAIASEHPESVNDALKTTEIYRASGYQNLVGMMDIMQVGALALALLFALNGFILFRFRQQRQELQMQPASVPQHS